jgi:hypothetical protein
LNPEIPSSHLSAETASWLRLVIGLSIVPPLLAIACAVQTTRCVAGRRLRTLWTAACCGVIAAAGPMLIRGALPWEDPYSGEGSPLATLISIVALGVFGAVASIPGVVVASIVVARSAVRAARRSQG